MKVRRWLYHHWPLMWRLLPPERLTHAEVERLAKEAVNDPAVQAAVQEALARRAEKASGG